MSNRAWRASVSVSNEGASPPVFDGEISMETGTSGPSGLENLSGGQAPQAAAPAQSAAIVYEDAYDGSGSWFGAGMLFGVILAMIIGIAAIVPALYGVEGTLVNALYPQENGEFSPTTVYAVAGGLFVVSLILGIIGLVAGKSSN